MAARGFISLKSPELWIAATLLAVAAILAVVNRDRRHIVANEASALGVLRTMNVALALYAPGPANGGASPPAGRFPTTLLGLQVKPTSVRSAASPDIFDDVQLGVAGGTIQKNGYIFVYQPGPEKPGGRNDLQYCCLTARPGSFRRASFLHESAQMNLRLRPPTTAQRRRHRSLRRRATRL